jgi:hypothetical protein
MSGWPCAQAQRKADRVATHLRSRLDAPLSAAAGLRHVWRHGSGVLAGLAAKAGSRWANRDHKRLIFRILRRPGEPGEPAEPAGQADQADPDQPRIIYPRCPSCGSPAPGGGFCEICEAPYTVGHAGQRAAWPAASLEEATSRARRMSADGEPYVVTEYPAVGGPGRAVATYVHGKPSQPQEGSTSMPPSRISTEHRAQRAARTGAAGIPSEWAAVVGQTADFEPGSDAELLDWMARQVTGLSAWAEALVDTYEHCTQVIGIDPQASDMLHDVADAAAQAAETMAAAKARFTEHYELPREFAANGGLMTHDGRWVTGEGA